jgi:hypothetical protein
MMDQGSPASRCGLLMRGRMGRMKQFSLRDLLFLCVIIALILGWWLDRRPVPARFQIQVATDHAYILDTATGEMWSQPVIGGQMSGDIVDIHAPKTPK